AVKLGVVVALLVAGACASVPDERRMTIMGSIPGTDQSVVPSFDDYRKGCPDDTGCPDRYLARRCGTLDCHGQLGRGMRLFSETGPRAFDATPLGFFPNTTGGAKVTEDELLQNYRSVVGLEPEVMAQVIAEGGVNPRRLLLLKKPLGLESHKGGRIMG